MGALLKQMTASCRPNILVEELPDETVVLIDEDRRVAYSINAAGGRIWGLLGPNRRLADLVDETVALYGIDPQTAESDVVSFCRSLEKCGLVRLQG